MDKPTVRELERFTNCVLCAVCYSSCPINGSDLNYLGPAALAKLYRFAIDQGIQKGGKRLQKARYSLRLVGLQVPRELRRGLPERGPAIYAIAKARKLIEEDKTGSRRGGE